MRASTRQALTAPGCAKNNCIVTQTCCSGHFENGPRYARLLPTRKDIFDRTAFGSLIFVRTQGRRECGLGYRPVCSHAPTNVRMSRIWNYIKMVGRAGTDKSARPFAFSGVLEDFYKISLELSKVAVPKNSSRHYRLAPGSKKSCSVFI